MQWPSVTLVISEIFLAYVVYTIYTVSLLFVAPSCEEGQICLSSYLSERPNLQLHIFSSVRSRPKEEDVDLVYSSKSFDYVQAQAIPVTLNVPQRTRQNGTMFLHVILVPDSREHKTYNAMQTDSLSASTLIKMTQYVVPEAEVFNLLGEKDSPVKVDKKTLMRPVTHMKSKVVFTIMTDDIKIPVDHVPAELMQLLKTTRGRKFLPIVTFDFLQTRHQDLVRITPQNYTFNTTILYNQISIEKLRLMLHVKTAMQNLKNLGFSDKDIDAVKGLFADTNLYLLAGTFFIAAIHLLFDFLAFKNDVSFWRRKDNLVGVSAWTVIWRAFSQIVIFLYLLDEGSSLLVLIPTGIGTIIELWKLKKILRPEVVRTGRVIPRIRFNKNNSNVAEAKTREFDAQSMRYLSYLLYPLVIAGAVYSLLYQPHKSWYSWSINSLVNGVYAFGFLFMLPQLFVNYKLKSVAHLPWRAFMYKAFNTFIDDIFAFIITMPAAHRIACFRDDAVFLIYLYQRWLYPVDKSRTDADALAEETVDFGKSGKKVN